MRYGLLALIFAAACGDSSGNGNNNDLSAGGGLDFAGVDLAGYDLTGQPPGPDMAGPPPYDWPQFNMDVQHSGNNTRETMLDATTVKTLVLKQQASFTAPVDGAPVYLTGVTTANGVQDLVFVNTAAADLIALDAKTLMQVWKKSHPFAGTCTSSNGSACYTTSMPAIDPNRMFVYAYGLDGKIHKHQVGDGTEITTNGWPELSTLKPQNEKGSSNLATAVAASGTAYLYAPIAGYPGDAGDYQGHVTTINLSDGSQKVFNTLCSDQTVHFTNGGTPDCAQTQSAVWARAGVIYRADVDKIYFGTGNGLWDTTGKMWGDSVLKLNPDGTGAGNGPVDSWTPTDQATLNANDADIGSTGPALLPTPSTSKVKHLMLQGAKEPTTGTPAPIRLLDLDNLSSMGAPGKLGGEIYTLPGGVPQGNEILTQPAVWVNPADSSTWVFIANDSGISALKLVIDGTGNPTLTSPWMNGNGGSSPIVANNILYYAGNGAGRNGDNTIYALDPTTGTTIWSATIAAKAGGATVGGIHWESPIVVHGWLYITSENGNTTSNTADGTGTLTAFSTP
jgi:hypothetical protein